MTLTFWARNGQTVTATCDLSMTIETVDRHRGSGTLTVLEYWPWQGLDLHAAAFAQILAGRLQQ